MTAVRFVVCVALLTASLLIPALLNRQPILYPDSEGYFHSGRAAVSQIAARIWPKPSDLSASKPSHGLERQEKDGISTARSVYYGAPFALAGLWAPIISQALLIALCLVVAVRRVLPEWRFAAVVVITGVSGISIFASTAMPDIFAGLSILSVAILLVFGRELPRLEYLFWLVVVLAAGLTHKATLAIIALVLLFFVTLWRDSGREVVALAAAIVLGAIGHLAVDLTVTHLTGRAPIAPPFLLARMVADGPAERYLRDVCPTRRFVTCNYLSKFSVTENQFLWSPDPKKSVMGTADRETRAAISAESGEIIRGTLARYSLDQIQATASNVARQFLTVGVREYGFIPNRLPLDLISNVMMAAYFIALAGSGWLLATGGGLRFSVVLIFGLFANAAVCGAISGVFDRYQGRVAWLAIFAFAAILAHRKQTA